MSTSKRMLITAGPTHEPIDAVRYIANRSSGRLGVALAEAARDAGWTVTLLLGPVTIEPPTGVQTLAFETSEDLAGLLEDHFPGCDLLIMAAAVADFRPAKRLEGKLLRGGQSLVLELQPTPDLVAQCVERKRDDQRVVGFALEQPAQLEQRARQKLHDKRLDAIVANPLETMGAAHISAKVFAASNTDQRIQKVLMTHLPKTEFAHRLIEWIEACWYS